MKNNNTIKINFTGGVIYPADLYNILVAASRSGILYVRFGLRQQLYLDVSIEELGNLTAEMDSLGVTYEVNAEIYPNIVSSYPAAQVFIGYTWLDTATYKKIFGAFDFTPKLKINICDSNQSFTPLFTGNINWVAAPDNAGYWYLFIRFPKTNVVYEWPDLIETESLTLLSAKLEELICGDNSGFYGNNNAAGEDLYNLIDRSAFTVKEKPGPLTLPAFKLPYYEGMNKYADHFWLGIYRRDEMFSIKFLKEACSLCVDTGIEEICSTTWKTIIIKNIREENKTDWYTLLDKHQVNVRHAQNELNFQVDDNSIDALKLKQHLVKYLNDDDTRTFGVCIGIKTKRKSEVFSSILVRRKPLIRIGKFEAIYLYDILCAKDFNPNERTAFAYSKDNPRFLLNEQLRRAILSYYKYNGQSEAVAASISAENLATEAEL